MRYIKIEENARFSIEDNNYTLERRVKSGTAPGGKKANKEFRWIIAGYFPDLVSLLQDYVKNAPSYKNAGETKAKNLKEIVECIQEAEKRIEKLIKGK